MIGGFLGAGKTATLLALARHFQADGRRVAVVINDLGGELSDAATLRASGVATEEVAGGHLTSRFPALRQALTRLAEKKPDFILVEVVGSGAHLRATVLEPLTRELGASFVPAPHVVVLEPRLAERVLGLDPGSSLGEPLPFLYLRQLEEADILAIAQIGPMAGEEAGRIERLRARLAADYPHASVLSFAAGDSAETKELARRLESAEIGSPPLTEFDYELYGQALAQLGWLDATIEFTLVKMANGSALLPRAGHHLHQALAGAGLLHGKIVLRTEDEPAIGLLHLGRESAPSSSRTLNQSLEHGELIINLRAETHPEKLHTALRAAIVELVREFPGLQTEFAHLHYFRPVKPARPAA